MSFERKIHSTQMRFERKVRKVLHKEGRWELLDATDNSFNVGPLQWESVIRHHCLRAPGSPYWMLLEKSTTPTRCYYCKSNMPVAIICLFKLQNWERIKP